MSLTSLEWQRFGSTLGMCNLNTAEEQNDIQRPTSTACELRLQDQKGPAAISSSSPGRMEPHYF